MMWRTIRAMLAFYLVTLAIRIQPAGEARDVLTEGAISYAVLTYRALEQAQVRT